VPDATAILILFLTHAVGAIAAFGSTLLALPLLLLSGWDLTTAVTVLLLGGTAQALLMAVLTGGGADRRALAKILLIAGLGLPVGIVTVAYLPQRPLQAILGVVLVAAGATRLAERLFRREYAPPAWALSLLLFTGGVIHGAFASGGAALTVYGRYVLRGKDAFRGTLSIMWIALNAVVLGGLLLRGRIDRQVLTMSLAGVPVILLATLLGERVARRVPQERFVDLVALILCIAGAITIFRNLT